MLVLVFPGVIPNMKLGTNQKGNLYWAQRSSLVDKEKEKWGKLFQECMSKMQTKLDKPPYSLSWEVRFQDKRNRDDDSVMSALKHARDSMVEVGFIPDDKNSIISGSCIDVILGSDEPGTTLRVRKYRRPYARQEE